jgi:hypothetical protein
MDRRGLREVGKTEVGEGNRCDGWTDVVWEDWHD